MTMRGYTLIELLVSLVIVALLLTIGLPGFNKVIKQNRTKTAALTILEAIETTRSTAVFNNQRALMRPIAKDWNNGWILFIDLNDDGELKEPEKTIQKTERQDGVTIKTNAPLRDYISFIGTGEGRKTGKRHGGAMLIGTMEICPDDKSEGYVIILSRGGRARLATLSAAECQDDEV